MHENSGILELAGINVRAVENEILLKFATTSFTAVSNYQYKQMIETTGCKGCAARLSTALLLLPK
jgi:hypothetical protein